MLLCWAPGNQSSIHDHADAHCFVKDLEGTLKEVTCMKNLIILSGRITLTIFHIKTRSFM